MAPKDKSREIIDRARAARAVAGADEALRKKARAERRATLDLHARINAARTLDELASVAQEVGGYVAEGILTASEGHAIRSLLAETRRSWSLGAEAPRPTPRAAEGPAGGLLESLTERIQSAVNIDELGDVVRELTARIESGAIEPGVGRVLVSSVTEQRQILTAAAGRRSDDYIAATVLLMPDEWAEMQARRAARAVAPLKPGERVLPPADPSALAEVASAPYAAG